jgi:hypothetical protein
MAIGPHVPRVIWRLEETKRLGGGGIAEDFRVVGRIDSVQAAAHHAPAPILAVVVAVIPRHGGGGEDAQGADNRKPYKAVPSTHGHFLRFADATAHSSTRLGRLVLHGGLYPRRNGTPLPNETDFLHQQSSTA